MKKERPRPDEAALRRVLENCRGTAAELILRLAWQAGLNRPQIHDLTWDAIDFASAELRLETHTVPLHEELLACLTERRQRPGSAKSPFVVLSDSRRAHLHSVLISRAASDALASEEALKEVTLKDLRNDFIIRAILERGKAYAMQVSGAALNTLYANFSQYLSQSRGIVNDGIPSQKTAVDADRLEAFLISEGTSPVAVGTYLAWKQGMTLEESVSLTWEQVDFENAMLRLPRRDLPMHPIVEQLLRQVRRERQTDADPHVLLTPNAKTPFRSERLTVVIRTAFCRAGLSTLHLGALPTLDEQLEKEEVICSYIRAHRFITRNDLMELLPLSENAAWKLLSRLTEQGKLQRMGTRYYLAGTIVPPEKQREAIIRYLRETGSSAAGDVAKMLGIEVRPCGYVLHKMVESGALIQQGQMYKLPEE